MSETTSRVSRGVVQTSTLGVGILLVAILVAMVNYFGWKYHQRLDWTGSQLYTLSSKTESILAQLDRDVEVVVFMSAGSPVYEMTKELLSRYEVKSPRIRVRELDPARNRAEAERLIEQHSIDRLDVVVFAAGDDRRVVESFELTEYDYTGVQFGQEPKITAFKGEQAFSGALQQLSQNEKPKILLTVGHGERRLDDFSGRGLSAIKEILGKENYEFEEWSPLAQPEVPEGTDLVVIAGPTASFVEPELASLDAYLATGGRLLVLLDPVFSPTGLVELGLEGWLAGYGVSVGRNLVVDPARSVPFFGADTLFIQDYEEHPITKALRQAEIHVVAAGARSVTAGDGPQGFTLTTLLKTSAEGWGESDLVNLRGVRKDEVDLAGPVALGVAVEGEVEAEEDEAPAAGEEEGEEEAEDAEAEAARPKLRLAVFGDVDFAANSQLGNAGNAALLDNALNWLLEREALLGIPPKTPEQVRLSLTTSQIRGVWGLVLALPVLSLALGGLVWWRRRR